MATPITSMVLQPGDPLRRSIGSTLVLGGCAAGAFTVFALLTSQVAMIRAQSPWQDDPYDAVVTFTMFFVPALLLAGMARAQLCRRSDPLPVSRVRGLLRAGSWVLFLVGVTALADWIALVLGADRTLWGPNTPWLAAALSAVSALAIGGASAVARTWRRLSAYPPTSDDWARDVVPLGMLAAERIAVVGPGALTLAQWTDATVVDGRWGIRRRPLGSIIGVSLAAGTVVAGALAVGESQSGWLFLIETAVFGCGTFAFVAAAQASLHLVDISLVERGVAARAAWVASWSAALAVPVALGFRDQIWSLVGMGAHVDSERQLASLLAGMSAVTWVSALAGRLLLDQKPNLPRG